jgi:hypothetical protein
LLRVTIPTTTEILRAVPNEKNASEQARLDRIERHINTLAESSTALKRELAIARRLAADRQRATQPIPSVASKSLYRNGRRTRT